MRLESIKRKIKMQKLSDLLSKTQSVALNTQSEEGQAFSSYASFYYDGVLLYVSLPKVSNHVENIKNNPKILALFVEDTGASKSVLQRHKTTLECDVVLIAKEDEKFDEIMPKFEGGTLDILIGIDGFNLYALTPTAGEVTFGLGTTYSVGGEKMNEIEESS